MFKTHKLGMNKKEEIKRFVKLLSDLVQGTLMLVTIGTGIWAATTNPI